MGMDLRRSTGTLQIGIDGWRDYLLLAYSAGWKPEGTQEPTYWHDAEWGLNNTAWEGTYFANNGQIVTDMDAQALADALAGVMDDIPDGQPLKRPNVLATDDPDYNVLSRIIERQIGYKHYLQEFIDFCRNGAFHIW